MRVLEPEIGGLDSRIAELNCTIIHVQPLGTVLLKDIRTNLNLEYYIKSLNYIQ